MQWRYQEAVELTVGRFVERAVPDVGGLERAVFDAVPVTASDAPEAWHISAFIPTSAQECWLEFDLLAHDAAADSWEARDLQALRGSRNPDDPTTYRWNDVDGVWEVARA